MTQPPPTPPAPPSLLEHLTALLFAAGAAAVLYSPTWGKALFFRDLLRWHYPQIYFYRQSLLQGELPLWCPYLLLGYPFLAEVGKAVLYPLSLLNLLVSAPAALKVFPAVHYLLTGYFMWRLLREWRLGQPAALFGALVWTASGYQVSMHLNFNYLVPAAWYPATLFCFHRLLHTRRLRWLALTALAWAMILLGGDPQAFLFAGALLLLYAVAAWPPPVPRLRKSLPPLLLAGGLASLLVLAQALPSLELGAWCTKLEGYSFGEATAWSFHPWRLLEFVWPGLWGPLFPPEEFWGQFLGLFDVTPWAGAVYLGLFPLALALGQLRRFREPPQGFLLLAFLLCFLLALGYYSPLYRLVWRLFPPYRIFRFPEKHLAPATFALAGLAAFGFERLLAPPAEKLRRTLLRGWLGLTALAAAAGLAMLLGAGRIAERTAPYLNQVYHFSIAPALIQAPLLHAAGRTLVVALAFLAALLLASRLAPVRRRLAPILLLLTAADLLALGRGQFFVADNYLYALKPAASRLIAAAQAGTGAERFRTYRSPQLQSPPALSEPFGFSENDQRVIWLRDTLESNLGVPEGLPELYGYEAARPRRIVQLNQGPLRIAVLEMLNVKYLLDGLAFGRIPEMAELDRAGEDPERNLLVWRNRAYFPPAYFVDGVAAAAGDDQARALLASADFRRQVILVRPASGSRPGKLFLPARLVSYDHQHIVAEVANPVAGHLVLSDSYFPGWEAAVDGRPARILSANYLVRAIAVEPGTHTVEFSYRPSSWRIGRDVSLVSLLLIPWALLLRRPPKA
jgi:hypothetical protein